MLELLLVAAVLVVVAFGFVVAFGAPYLPTLKPQIETALDLLDLKPGQTMLEIGSGDGRVLLAAAARGWQVTGYELNPILVLISKWRARKYPGKITVIWGDAFRKKWPITDGVFVFGLDKLMPKLSTKIVQSGTHGTKLASVAFKLPDVQPKATKNGVFLYELPLKNHRPT